MNKYKSAFLLKRIINKINYIKIRNSKLFILNTFLTKTYKLRILYSEF